MSKRKAKEQGRAAVTIDGGNLIIETSDGDIIVMPMTVADQIKLSRMAWQDAMDRDEVATLQVVATMAADESVAN